MRTWRLTYADGGTELVAGAELVEVQGELLLEDVQGTVKRSWDLRDVAQAERA